MTENSIDDRELPQESGLGSRLASTAYRVLSLDLELREYPILRDEIRKRMREEMFRRGIVRVEHFEEQVRARALGSQKREGLYDPERPELAEVGEIRMSRIRDVLTDFTFANNLPHSHFRQIVADVLGERNQQNPVLSFNPETAPMNLLFAQAAEFEKGDEADRKRTEHHLKEIIVVLTKGMLTDQLAVVGLAREHFRVSDLKEITRRRIGRGKVGGKAVGMQLAWRVLQEPSKDDPFDIGSKVVMPESWYVASDLHYEFAEENDLYGLSTEKYKDLATIRSDFESLQERVNKARLPDGLVRRLDHILDAVGDAPLVARSSSLLEDSFGTAFAGKYETLFCPNQGTREQRLAELCSAIRQIYASAMNPNALAYRKQMGLIDYDERMAILLQRVVGRRWGKYFFPQVAGVGFSHNPYRWTPQIDRRGGFLRMVWGLGTRAVNRVERDHPRMVALSNPGLRPERTGSDIRKYSQHSVDAIDLESNLLVTVPVEELVRWDYPGIRYIAGVAEGGEVNPIHMADPRVPASNYVITFDPLLHKSIFAPLMRAILQKLERAYGHPVDIEFAADILPGPAPDFRIYLLQCRPQASRKTSERFVVPTNVPVENTVFSSSRTVGSGRVPNIRYVVYVDPQHYGELSTLSQRSSLARVIGRLNEKLDSTPFVLVGPGRWGSSNPELGVPVSYADIFNADALVEVPMAVHDEEPEASYGTHFFQDLIESDIHPVAVYPEKGDFFNFAFFRDTPNCIEELLPDHGIDKESIKVIDVPACRNGKVMELIMDDSENESVLAFITDQS